MDSHVRGRIARVSIQGFRSLMDISDLELPQLTVLIGSNGAGKSNLIRFFSMLGWMLRGQHLQEFVLRHGGGDDQLFMGSKHTQAISASLHIQTPQGDNEYAFELSYNPSQDNLYFSREAFRFSRKGSMQPNQWFELAMPARESQLIDLASQGDTRKKTAKTIATLLQRCATYQFHDTSEQANIKKSWDVSDCAWLRHDGGNLAAILYRLHEHDHQRYQMIVRQIQRVLPTFSHFVLDPMYEKIALRWQGKQSEKTFGAHLTSDGSLRLFCLLTLINLPAEMLPDVLFLDEPELGLHPHAITLVAAGLKRIARHQQVFIATQSPALVDCFELENMIVASTSAQGGTQLKTLKRLDYQQWLDDEYQISDLWLTDVIGAQP